VVYVGPSSSRTEAQRWIARAFYYPDVQVNETAAEVPFLGDRSERDWSAPSAEPAAV
jgi:hypothetical protein